MIPPALDAQLPLVTKPVQGAVAGAQLADAATWLQGMGRRRALSLGMPRPERPCRSAPESLRSRDTASGIAGSFAGPFLPFGAMARITARPVLTSTGKRAGEAAT